MSDKKHIDRIFQEKLKDFEATPNKAVWNKISSQLENPKKDRKIIPLWWKVAGVAALLLLLLTVGNFIFSDSSDLEPTIIVNSDNEQGLEDTSNGVTNSDGKTKSVNNQILQENDNDIVNTSDKGLNFEIESQNDSNDSKIASPSNSSNPIVTLDVSNKTENKDDSELINKSTKDQTPSYSKDRLANTKPHKLELDEDPNEIVKNIQKKNDVLMEKESSKIDLANNTKVKENTGLKKKDASLEIKESPKKEELVLEQDQEKIPLTENVIVSNEDINEEEKETINRWQINPNFAPVYFNSLSKGSSIDNQFVDNSKSGNINFSYGINAGYTINDRLTIKSGIHKLKLSYDTENVIAMEGFAANSNASVYRNIKFSSSSNVMFLSANNVSLAQVPGEFSSKLESTINQELEYIELPLELKYNISKKKLGLNVIGGFSMFLLSDNSVYAIINDVKTPIGEANNLNSTSYSANLGLGLDYNISKRIQLNVDPMFKYQINTFNNTAGDFKPYFIGVYSGINVKF